MSPDYPTLYARSIERHLVLIRNLTGTIAEGGDLKAVVSRLVDALDALDVLGADPEADEVLRQAWLAAGGTDDDYPVVVSMAHLAPHRSLIDGAAAAEYLGVTERWIREAVYRRRIPYHKVGKFVRFDPTDLDRYIEASRVEVVAE